MTAQTAALGALPPEQRELYFRSGGLLGLVAAHQRTLVALSYMKAGDSARYAEDDEDYDPLSEELAIAEHRAALAVLTNAAGGVAKTLKALGEVIEVPGGNVTGLRELAEAYFAAKATPQLSQRAFLYPVRRFIECHGDLPLTSLKMEHLRVLADEMKRLTPSRVDGVQKMPFHANARAAKSRGLELMTDSARQKAVDHLKYLTAWAKHPKVYLNRLAFQLLRVYLLKGSTTLAL